MKLRTKFSLFISLFTAAVLISVVCFFYLAEKKKIKVEQRKQMELELSRYETLCREAIITKQYISLMNYIGTIKLDRSIKFVTLTDASETILIHDDIALRGRPFEGTLALDAIQTRAIETIRYTDAQGNGILEMIKPVYFGDVKAAAARIGYLQTELDNSARTMFYETGKRILRIGVAAVIGGILISSVFVLRITRKLQKLVTGVRTFGKGDLDHRIQISSNDELADLAREFNGMAAKLSELDRLIKEFTATVSSDLKPVAISTKRMLQRMQGQEFGPVSDMQLEVLTSLIKNTDAFNNFSTEVSYIAKLKAGVFDIAAQPFQLSALTGEIAAVLLTLANKKGVKIMVDVPAETPQVLVDPGKLRHVFIKLVSMLIEHACPDSTLLIMAAPTDDRRVLVVVRSIRYLLSKKLLLERSQQSYAQFKSNPSDSAKQEEIIKMDGNSLSLMLVKSIVAMHGSSLWLEKENNELCFMFTLPRFTQKK